MKHGASRRGALSREYRIWKNMRNRCTNPNNPDYEHYGGRGVKVCERWESFACFSQDMGIAPSDKHTLDRRDVNKGYEPSNCRWSTQTEQQRNRTNNKLNEASAEAIRSAVASGQSQQSVADRFGVSKKLVNEISKGRAWKRPEQPSLFGAGGL